MIYIKDIGYTQQGLLDWIQWEREGAAIQYKSRIEKLDELERRIKEGPKDHPQEVNRALQAAGQINGMLPVIQRGDRYYLSVLPNSRYFTLDESGKVVEGRE